MEIKRSFDILISVLGLAALSPLFIVLAIIIKATSRGPIFFVQNRIGLRGRPFRMIKFRTMERRAEANMPAQVVWDGPIFRVPGDPRVTGIGHYLRQYGLDELPQLFNVLAGQMSIVGPRPHLREEVEKYEDWHHERLAVKPGITCIWQVSDRHNVSFEEWIRMDLHYVRNRSAWLDFRILLATVEAMLFGRKPRFFNVWKAPHEAQA